ncbi:MAG: hypothetical protein GQ557_02530 [Mycoplasmataceae bacterium]|nr:hypothetical protein [Mycoplasmataceae bacterium]
MVVWEDGGVILLPTRLFKTNRKVLILYYLHDSLKKNWIMRKSLKYLLLPLLSIILVNCDEEEPVKPIEVETGVVISVDYESAIVTGGIIEFGKGIDAFGHCWSTNPIPSINDEKTTVSIEVGGDFQSEITGLIKEEKYYFRSYALNEDEIVYGQIKEFITTINTLKIGLVAFYPFDGNANDYSDNNNHSTNYGAELTTDRFGNENSAYEFDGLNDYMQLANTLDITEGLTFSFWINSNGIQDGENNGTVICKYNMAYDYHCFSIGTHNNLVGHSLLGNFYASQYNTDYRDCAWSNMMTVDDIPSQWDSNKFDLINPMELPLNNWVFCTINVTDTEVQAWINGVLTVKKEREYTTYYNSENEPTYIGNNLLGGEGSNNHFYGSLDELRVYNRALTENEIQELYHEGGWNN